MFKQKYIIVIRFSMLILAAYIFSPQNVYASMIDNHPTADTFISSGSLNKLQGYNDCIEGFVWEEVEGNDIMSAEESGVNKVRVHLYDYTGTELDVELTDEDGYFIFENLRPGLYNIKIIGTFGYRFNDMEPTTSHDPAREFESVASSSQCSTGESINTAMVLSADPSSLNATAVERIELFIEYQNSEPPAVKVSWTTSIEINLAGFYILRSNTGRHPDAIRINPNMIVGRGTGENIPVSYEYLDYSIRVRPNTVYSYWLSEKEISGSQIDHGPIHEKIIPAEIGGERNELFLPFITK